MNSIIINNIETFDIEKTFECGQCFRFNKTENGYEGVVGKNLVRLSESPRGIEISGITEAEFEGYFRNYFDLDTDYLEINKKLSKDKVMRDIIPFSSGIRILRQPPFETLVSFIISASNNIPRIKKIVSALCENFGESFEYDGKTYYAFPTPERLAALEVSDLSPIKAGFRDKYIIDCARKVASGEVDLDAVRCADYETASKMLMSISGVGRKVADCALLYGFGFSDCFPKDVWIKRILGILYGTDTDEGLDFFGHGGVAQQYLFYYARENNITEKV